MIIIRMSGGLGNQMFQYALYLKLRSLGREVCFDDKSQYDEETFRNSSQKRRPKHLDIFGITYPSADGRCHGSSEQNPEEDIGTKIAGEE